MRILILIFAGLLTVSCSEKSQQKTAYFGGQILNPKSKLVYLYKDSKLIDSTELSRSAKFSFNIKGPDLGLYSFKHGFHSQAIYLEPNDSLLMRLNTWDFNGSLMFSGKGAGRNNFLINLYVQNAKSQNVFNTKYYRLNESAFESIIDSIYQVKSLLFTQFKSEVKDRSPEFDKLAEAAILYPLYEKKEAYAFKAKRKQGLDKLPKLSPVFYDFRKNVEINNEKLAYFYPHFDYVQMYLYHKSFEQEEKDSSYFWVSYMENALKELKIESVKNDILREGIWGVLMNHDLTNNERDKAQRLFFDHCTDSVFVQQISNLIRTSNKLKKGSLIPNLSLTATDGSTTQLYDLIKGHHTALYTWPDNDIAIENFAKRLNYLEKHYPNFLFIGVNTKNKKQDWLKHIKQKGINADHQFMLSQPSDWLLIDFPIAILIDKDNIIQNNMTLLAYTRFEKQLRSLSKDAKMAKSN
ncbi:hypothetical protein MWU59_05205 [Flavobacteriaceae bacterium F08102]|nr:hypothetical protein [Flavobacteriaceae bacterium F08102]